MVEAQVTADDTEFFINRGGICLGDCPDDYLRSMLEGYLQANYLDMEQAREILLSHPQLSRMLEVSLTGDFLGDPDLTREDISADDRPAINRLRELYASATDLSGAARKQYEALFSRLQGARATPPASELPIPTFVDVPGGTFTMGCASAERDGNCDDDEKPPHEVTVPAFYMSVHEVTNAQFAAFLNAAGNQEEGGVEWYELVVC